MRWRSVNFKTIKPRRIKKSLLKKVLVLLGIVLIALGLYRFLTTFFLIKTIKIVGDPSISLKEVEKLGGQNLLFLDQRSWQEQIKKENPNLKEVEIKKELPSQVLIKFKEREPQAAIFNPVLDVAYLIDEEGIILGQEKEKSQLPLIIASLQNFKISDRIKDESIDVALKIISILEESAWGAKFEVNSENQVLAVTLTNDVLLLVNLEKKKEKTLDVLQILVKKFKIEGNWPKKIDLRFEKPVLTF